MSLRVAVEGGTNAGTRPPFLGRAEPWWCECTESTTAAFSSALPDGSIRGTWTVRLGRPNPGYLAACPDCGERRPSNAV